MIIGFLSCQQDNRLDLAMMEFKSNLCTAVFILGIFNFSWVNSNNTIVKMATPTQESIKIHHGGGPRSRAAERTMKEQDRLTRHSNILLIWHDTENTKTTCIYHFTDI